MKYTFLCILIFGKLLFCEAQNSENVTIEYDLGNGGSIVLSKQTHDSLQATIVGDSSAIMTILRQKIDELYCVKRNNLFSNLTGQYVPDFEARDTEGGMQRPGRYRGRVLVLHFWSFWGNSFENEIPELNRLLGIYEKEGLAVLSFTGITLGEDEKKKLQEHPIKFPLVDNAYIFADDFFKSKLIRPCLVFVNKEGKMVHFYDGWMLPKSRHNLNPVLHFDLEDKVKALIK